MTPVPKDALAIFERGGSNQNVIDEGIRNSNGEIPAKRTIREWRKSWKQGTAEPYGDSIEGVPASPTADGFKVVSDKSATIQTLDQLIEAYGIDMTIWREDRHHVKYYPASRKQVERHLEFDDGKITGTLDDSGDITTVTLCSIEAWFVRREELPYEKMLDDILKNSRSKSLSSTV